MTQSQTRNYRLRAQGFGKKPDRVGTEVYPKPPRAYLFCIYIYI